MKSRHDSVRASVLAAVVVVLGMVGSATAQVTGSGTPGTIPLWTSSGTLGNSSITQSGHGDQNINGSLSLTGSLFLPNTTGPNTGVITIGGLPVLYTVGRNIFFGPSAGNFTTTAVANTATGDRALDSITSGVANTAMGSQALFSNTTAFFNTAMGSQALFSNTTAFFNTAMGVQALFRNTSAFSNTAILLHP